jgi:hypothetical protein
VEITGVDFAGATAVEFGATGANSFTVNSPTSITAVSPAVTAAGKVDVSVTTPQGTSPISATDTFEFTPTVTGVSPNTGPPAGGTNVTITGTGFAVGASATQITFGETQALAVNCTTTTECTATTPGLSTEEPNTVDVTATVNNAVSPQTAADQFHYHGLYLVGEVGGTRGRLPVGYDIESGMRGFVEAREVNVGRAECSAFVGGGLVSNGETTDELDMYASQFTGCLQEQWFHDLPFSFALRLSDDGSATIEGSMGVRMGNGCVYEGHRMDGGFAPNREPLRANLSGTFTFVAEEEPGAGCAATASVGAFVGAERVYPETELIR